MIPILVVAGVIVALACLGLVLCALAPTAGAGLFPGGEDRG